MGSLSAQLGLDDVSTEVERLRQQLGPSAARPAFVARRSASAVAASPAATGHGPKVVLEQRVAAPAAKLTLQTGVKAALAAKRAELAAQRSKTLWMIDQLPAQSPQRAEAEQAAAAAVISPTTRNLVDRVLSLASPAVGPAPTAAPERSARSGKLVISPHSTLKSQLAQQRQRAALRSAVATAKMQNDGGALTFQAALHAARVRASVVKGVLSTASDEESSPSEDGSDKGRKSDGGRSDRGSPTSGSGRGSPTMALQFGEEADDRDNGRVSPVQRRQSGRSSPEPEPEPDPVSRLTQMDAAARRREADLMAQLSTLTADYTRQAEASEKIWGRATERLKEQLATAEADRGAAVTAEHTCAAENRELGHALDQAQSAALAAMQRSDMEAEAVKQELEAAHVAAAEEREAAREVLEAAHAQAEAEREAGREALVAAHGAAAGEREVTSEALEAANAQAEAERLLVAVAIGKTEKAAAELVQSRVEWTPEKSQQLPGGEGKELTGGAITTVALAEQEEELVRLRVELDEAGAKRR